MMFGSWRKYGASMVQAVVWGHLTAQQLAPWLALPARIC
jgi:hypothetical protein